MVEPQSPFDVRSTLSRLAEARPVFHNEADFQHALAWQAHVDDPTARIRLETRPLPGVRLDVFVETSGHRTALELKYLVKRLVVDLNHEHFELRPQQAHDVRRYDVVKDVGRLEMLLAAKAADRATGVVLTNDPLYWSVGRPGSIDEAFHIAEGRRLAGNLAWAASAGAGTTKGRRDPLIVAGNYQLTWQTYRDLGVAGGLFRVLVIDVQAPST